MMKIFKSLPVLFFMFNVIYLSAQSGPLITLPANWYPSFPVTNWLDSRTQVIQTLNTQSISFSRNAADELIWNSTVFGFQTETDLLFSQTNQLTRISVYVHDQSNAVSRHQQWFTLFSAQYGSDYTETDNADIHMYRWPNENNVAIELIRYKQNPNFAIRAEFLHQ